MKIAFVDNLPVGGGLSRFSHILCKNLVEHNPDLYIDYFVHWDNLQRTPELKSLPNVITLKLLVESIPFSLLRKLKSQLYRRFIKPSDEKDKLLREIQSRVKDYDLAFFPSAHMMPYPELTVPIVGTIHDFNWKYFFGRQIFSKEFVSLMDKEVLKWMTNGKTVSSSHDVVTEAKKLYPGLSSYPTVIPIAPVTFLKEVEEKLATSVLKDLEIDYPYIIFPGNFFPHKNHLNLFSAFFLLKRRTGFENFKLILTGVNTDQIQYGIAEKNGVRLINCIQSSFDYDVRGLGYLSNEVIDALISKANLLVSSSIYEAICTPGMDAWSFGTPTAISDIPPFREHETTWGIKSAFFDPMDPKNIADVLESYLNDYENALEDGRQSKVNMTTYTWKHVAEGYMKIFKEVVQNENTHNRV